MSTPLNRFARACALRLLDRTIRRQVGASRCSPEAYNRGNLIAKVFGSTSEIEVWVQNLRTLIPNVTLDWHFMAGIGNVLFLGDAAARAEMVEHMKQTPILQIDRKHAPGIIEVG